MSQFRRRGSHVTLPEPVARRLQRPSWRDGRLIAGLALVLLALIGGASAIGHFDSSVEMLQATRPLVPGQTLAKGDVKAVKVRMDGQHAGYLRAGSALPSGQVVRAVRPGELVPSTAIGSGAALRQKTIGLPVGSSQSGVLVTGSVVDVYVSAKQTGATGDTAYDDPQLLVSDVTVSQAPRVATGLAANSADNSVHVLVPDEKVSAVLAAVNKGAKVDLVPTAGSPVRGGS